MLAPASGPVLITLVLIALVLMTGPPRAFAATQTGITAVRCGPAARQPKIFGAVVLLGPLAPLETRDLIDRPVSIRIRAASILAAGMHPRVSAEERVSAMAIPVEGAILAVTGTRVGESTITKAYSRLDRRTAKFVLALGG
jgi:hypothetical protein